MFSLCFKFKHPFPRLAATMAREPCLHYYITHWWGDGFLTFSQALTKVNTTTSAGIWTLPTNSVFQTSYSYATCIFNGYWEKLTFWYRQIDTKKYSSCAGISDFISIHTYCSGKRKIVLWQSFNWGGHACLKEKLSKS